MPGGHLLSLRARNVPEKRPLLLLELIVRSRDPAAGRTAVTPHLSRDTRLAPPPQWRTRGGSEAAGRDPPPAASTGKGARVPSGTWDGRHRGRTDGPVVLGIVGMTTTPAPWLLSLLLPPRRAEANGPFLLYHTSLPRCCHIKIVVPFLDLPALDPNLIAYSYEWGVI